MTDAEYARLCAAAEAVGAVAGFPPPPAGYALIGTLSAVDVLFHIGGYQLLPERVFYGWVLSRAGETIAVLRGTESLTEWVEDADAAPIFHKASGGHVHQGFYAIFSTLQLDTHDPVAMLAEGHVTLTGHSLGAPLALYLAVNLAEHSQVTGKFFASPRPGDGTFCAWAAAKLKAYESYRYAPDLVPDLPAGLGYALLPETTVIPYDPAIPTDPVSNHHAETYAWLLEKGL